ncbi:hypothetical protein EG68_04135 [Paragonimus skrjabini miyazakii]|uniref:2-iminobutanoate/2-iminopropanoate deaminase n=1 Tax=Paragonimus skrjabini miyazakii TaxID=59628 RepID=A0A8S9YT21_9TREM|nr:hypothetical protein EG68_04135 [Paragonimus skrjabini miyazakii]
MSSVVRRVICTNKAPKAIGPYSQAVAVNNTLYVSGQLGLVPETMDFPSDDVEAQTHQVFRNIKGILEAAGLTLANVVKTTVLLADMNDFTKVNTIYGQYFKVPYPARAAFQVACLPKLAKVEIEAVAIMGSIKDE